MKIVAHFSELSLKVLIPAKHLHINSFKRLFHCFLALRSAFFRLNRRHTQACIDIAFVSAHLICMEPTKIKSWSRWDFNLRTETFPPPPQDERTDCWVETRISFPSSSHDLRRSSHSVAGKSHRVFITLRRKQAAELLN